MLRTTWIALVTALACCLWPAQLRAAVESATLTNYDVRANSPRKAIAAGQQRGHEKLEQSTPGAIADFDPVLNTPKWIHAGGGFLTAENGEGKAVSRETARQFDGDRDKALKGFLQEHRELFRHGPEVIEGATQKREHSTKFLRTVAWEQQVDGIPVFDSILVAHTTARGELISVSSLFLPEPAKAADKGTRERAVKMRKPDVTAEGALRIAVTNLGEEIVELSSSNAQPADATLKQKFQVKPLPGEAAASLVWFPLDGDTLRLTWDVQVTRRERGERFRLVVDAETGAVLLRRKLTVEVSDVQYNVFTSDSPSPLSPGLSAPINFQPPLVSRQLLSISNVNAAASPLGWISDGINETRGNNVDAHLDRDADDRADLPRVQAMVNQSGQRVFNFPLNLDQHPTNSSSAAVVQLFYWCNWMHDKLYELGFTESAGNYQKDNFGRGGADNDPVLAQAQDGSGFNNANFTPSGDGSPGRIQMFLFNMTSPFRDGSLDAEVILHEYAHGLSDRLVGGGVGIFQLQTLGMGEGWSDFFGESLLSEFGDDPGANYAVGGYVTYQLNGLTANYFYGIRRYPYTTNLNVNPLTFKDIDPTRASSHPGIPRNPIITGSGAEVHRQGEVWCSMLWDMRASLLRKYAPTNATDYTNANMRILRYVTLGLQLSPPNPSFVQARDAILQAVRVLQGDGDTNEVWRAFARRGLGLSASGPDSATTIGVFEAYDTPSQPEFDVQPRGPITFHGVFEGPFEGTATNTTIFNFSPSNVTWAAHSSVPWLRLSPVSGVLASGASVDCVASLTELASTLPIGDYTGTLFFTNMARTQVITRVVMLSIDESAPPPPDPLIVSSTNALLIQGPRGGPFTPTQRLEQITNTGTNSLSWTAFTTNTWLGVTPTNGFLAPLPEVQDAVIQLTPAANALAEGIYDGAVTFVNSNSGARVDVPVSLRVGRTDYLTEEFLPEQFDLRNTTLTFTPDLSRNTYSVCRETAVQFPTDPVAGTIVTLADDAFIQVELTNNRQVSLYGVKTNALFIAANGHVTFDPVIDTNFFYPGLAAYFAASRASAFYVDLNPATGGTISYLQLSNRFVVTYEDVPEFGVANVNNAQIELFYDGSIRMTWLRVDATNNQSVVTGLSRGGGLPQDFVRTDLSASEHCGQGVRLLLPLSMIEGESQSGLILFNSPTTNDFVLTLTASDPNEVFLEESPIIPAGTISFPFAINAVDDGEADGTSDITITAMFGNRTLSGSFFIDDAQSSSVFVNVRSTAREGELLVAGGTVYSEMPAVRPLTVSLFSDDASRARVAPTVTIPTGASSATFDILLPDDNLIQDTQTVHITAYVVNWFDDLDAIRVSDNESRLLKVTLPQQVVEGQGTLTNGGIVTFSGLTATNVVVSLQSEISTLIALPTFVTNSAGKSNVSFAIVIGDNTVTNGFDRLRVMASAQGFLTGTGSVDFVDDERPFEAINPSPAHLATDVARNVVLSWTVNSNAPPTTMYDVYFGTNANLASLSPIVSTTSRSVALPFDLDPERTYYWQVVARLIPFPDVPSAVWRFSTTPLLFKFDTIASPQFTGEPFPIAVRATDRSNLTVTNYSGSLTITNFAPVKGTAKVAITEVDTTNLRAVEFVNVSDRSLNIAGWQVALYDVQNWPAPRALFTIPGPSVAPPGGLFVVRNLPPPFNPPGAYPNFVVATNILWSNNADDNPVAVMLLDNLGNVVDFVCAFGADPSLISIPQTVPSSEWSGVPVPPNLEAAFTLQRVGNRDLNSSNDWRVLRRSVSTNNVGLISPFTNTASVAFSGTLVLDTFISGVATGSMTVLEPARGLAFGATENSGSPNPRGTTSSPIDVFARNDIAVALHAPESALVGDTITYRVSVTNSGPLPAIGVTLSDSISALGTILGGNPSQGSCVLADSVVTCDLGIVPANSIVTVDITASASERGGLTNMVSVARSDVDAFLGNNSAMGITSIAFPQLAVLDSTNSEPATTAGMIFNVRLSAPYSQTCTVAYATSDGTAMSGVDYEAASGVLVFPPGITNRPVSVTLQGDSLAESNETFFLLISNPKNMDITRPLGTGTIMDNDPAPQVSVLDTTATEGDAGATVALFDVRLNVPSGRILNVSYRTANGTALHPLDYIETYGFLVFEPGVTNRTVAVSVLGDTVPEPTKAFSLNLISVGNGTVGRGQGQATILDDDVAALDRFAFEALPGTNYVGAPVPFTLTARDGNGAIASNFFGPLPSLFAGASQQPLHLGTNATNWTLPLATSFHDARVQSIYLSNEMAGAERLLGLSLDVVAPPAQALSNFTIRVRHTSRDRHIGNAWEGSNWIVVCQRDVSIVSTGWVSFPFSTPFQYNGRDNIMIDFSFDNASFSTDGICRSSPTEGNRSLYLRTDSAYGRPTDWPLDGVANKPPGTPIARVPNIQLLVDREIPIEIENGPGFVAGVWSGTVTISGGAQSFVLRAVDTAGHFGESVPVAAIPLKIATVARSGDEVVIRVETLVGRSYVTEVGPTSAGPWTHLETKAGTGGVIEFRDAATDLQSFYKIRLGTP